MTSNPITTTTTTPLTQQIGYLCGVPVANYSLSIGKEHTDFAEMRMQKRLIERRLADEEIDTLALVAMAGATAEAMKYDEVCCVL